MDDNKVKITDCFTNSEKCYFDLIEYKATEILYLNPFAKNSPFSMPNRHRRDIVTGYHTSDIGAGYPDIYENGVCGW